MSLHHAILVILGANAGAKFTLSEAAIVGWQLVLQLELSSMQVQTGTGASGCMEIQP